MPAVKPTKPLAPAYYRADLARFDALFRKADAIVTLDDGFAYIDEEKAPADAVRAYRLLMQYGMANGLPLSLDDIDRHQPEEPPMLTDVIDYSTTVNAQHLRLGYPIHLDGVYATVAALILDDDRRRMVVQARDDDGRLRVLYLDCGTPVDVGTVTQYGIDCPDRAHVMPVHLKHGALGLRQARAYGARRGGHVVVRQAIPDDMSLSGGVGVDDWQPLPTDA